MKKILFAFFCFLFIGINAQRAEVTELIKVNKKYDSILINYQKKAKDSLSNLPKRERNKIMAEKEKSISMDLQKYNYAQLDKIKIAEQKEKNEKKEEVKFKCNNYIPVVLPNIKPVISSYKPTYSKDVKSNDYGLGENQQKSLVTFIVTADGNIEEVKAEGQNEKFNKYVELMLYSIEKKWTVLCQNGFGVRTRYRLPITMTFK